MELLKARKESEATRDFNEFALPVRNRFGTARILAYCPRLASAYALVYHKESTLRHSLACENYPVFDKQKSADYLQLNVQNRKS